MSYSTVLGVAPDRRPVALEELHNGHGWSPSIWGRLLRSRGVDDSWMWSEAGSAALDDLWNTIEILPEWQQAALVLTFDTGVIPFSEFERTADELDEFEARLSAPPGHVNHVPTVARILRTMPEVPFLGMWGTSVSENPFDPWDSGRDEPGSGVPLGQMYLLERHRYAIDRGRTSSH